MVSRSAAMNLVAWSATSPQASTAARMRHRTGSRPRRSRDAPPRTCRRAPGGRRSGRPPPTGSSSGRTSGRGPPPPRRRSGPSRSVTLETMKSVASSPRADSRSSRCAPSAATVTAASRLLPMSFCARARSSASEHHLAHLEERGVPRLERGGVGRARPLRQAGQEDRLGGAAGQVLPGLAHGEGEDGGEARCRGRGPPPRARSGRCGGPCRPSGRCRAGPSRCRSRGWRAPPRRAGWWRGRPRGTRSAS